jgi:hypothetical protein
MLDQINPLKLLEQLSPSEKLIGIVLLVLLGLLPSILDRFSSENLRLIILFLFTTLILIIAWLTAYKNKKIKEDKRLKNFFEEKLKNLREREFELIDDEQKNLTEIVEHLRDISRQVTMCLEKSTRNSTDQEKIATLKPVMLDVQSKIRPIITKLEVRLQTSDTRANDLMSANFLFENSDRIAEELASEPK